MGKGLIANPIKGKLVYRLFLTTLLCQASLMMYSQCIDFANLQSPSNATICLGGSAIVYGQVYEPGITENGGANTSIEAQLGYHNANTNPSGWPAGNWVNATYNLQSGNNDEYQASIGSSLTAGTYFYTFRFRYNSTGCDWQYGGYSSSGGGFWNGVNHVNGTLVVNPINTVTASSSTPSLCINTLLTNITRTTTGATGISNAGVSGANGLPAGVSATWANNTITISGTPTATGTFNYSIPLTGGCGSVNATGTIVVNAINTVTASSSTPSLCINTLLTNITRTTTGATGISNAGVSGANGLPAGVSATWANNTITISGTPTASGTFNYSIPLTGGCGSVNATGTIVVNAINTVSASSSTPSLCINTLLTNITRTTTGATGISNAGVSGANGLPAGVSATWSNNTITISGTPTASGTFNYSIPLTGGCGSVNASGTIIVFSLPVIDSIVVSNALCFGDSNGMMDLSVSGGIPPYTYVWSNGTTNQDLTGVPAGSYAVMVYDSNTCTRSSSSTIDEPDPLSAVLNSTAVLCHGGNTGSVDVTVSGGTVPYSYAWNNSSTSQNLDDVAADNYTVNITDDHGCLLTESIVVNQPSPLTATASAPDFSVCADDTVQITVTANGGIPPYLGSGSYTYYPFDTPTPTETVQMFDATITDFNGCTVSIFQPVTFYAATPTGVITSSTGGFSLCPDASLNLSASLPNGVWSSQDISIATVNPSGELNPNNNLFDGASVEACYTRVISHGNNNCDATTCANVILLPKPRITVLSSSTNQTGCAGTELDPIQWSLENNTGYTLSGLPAGISYSASANELSGSLPFVTTPTDYAYTLTATHNNGCQSASSSGILTVAVTPRVESGLIEKYFCSEDPYEIVIESNAIQNIPASNYLWSAPSISGTVDTNDIAVGGAGASVSGSAHNLLATEAVLNYLVTASEGACTSEPFTIKVHVLPRPVIGSFTTNASCPGDTMNFIPPSANNIIPIGTSYTWAPSSLPLGISGAGISGGVAISSITAGNFQSSSDTVISVPHLANAIYVSQGQTCSSTFVFQLPVYPRPDVSTPQNFILCSGETFNLNSGNLVLSGDDVFPQGTLMRWNAPSNCNNCGGNQQATFIDAMSQTLTSNDSSVYVYNVYLKTTSNLGGCELTTPFQVNATVLQQPVITDLASITRCEGELITAIPLLESTSTSGQEIWTWTAGGDTTGIAMVGDSAVIPQFYAYAADADEIARDTVTLILNNNNPLKACIDQSFFTVNVYPEPVVNGIMDSPYCEGDPVAPIVFSGHPQDYVAFSYVATGDNIGFTPLNVPTMGSGTNGFIAFNTNPVNSSSVIVTVTPSIQTPACLGDSDSFTITINPGPSAPTLSPNLGGTVCDGTTGEFLSVQNPLPGYNYVWDSFSQNVDIVAGQNNDICVVSFENNVAGELTEIFVYGVPSSGCSSDTAVVEFSVTDAVAPCADIAETPDGNGLVYLNNSMDSYQWGLVNMTPGPDFLEVTLDETGAGNNPFYYGSLLQDTVDKRVFVKACLDGCCATTFYPFDCGDNPILQVLGNTSEAASFLLYPNPAGQTLFVQSGMRQPGTVSFVITDLTGQEIQSSTEVMSPESVIMMDLQQIPPGAYLLRVNSTDGNQTHKFLKIQ